MVVLHGCTVHGEILPPCKLKKCTVHLTDSNIYIYQKYPREGDMLARFTVHRATVQTLG